MRIAVHILAYNVNRFLPHVLENCAQHVERVFIAHPSRPWAYNAEARSKKTNPTSAAFVTECAKMIDPLGEKVTILSGDWLTEEEMRNACLDAARAEEIDWLLIQDADEFYEKASWAELRPILTRHANQPTLRTTWYNFWKSAQYCIVDNERSLKQTNAGFAVNCRMEVRFTDKRNTSHPPTVTLDLPCFHYGYVMSDAEMSEKVSTWGHANDFNPHRWYLNKWKNWSPKTRFVNPIIPTDWDHVTRFPGRQPEFSWNFMIPVSYPDHLSVRDRISDFIYNAKAITRIKLRQTRAALLSASGKNVNH